MYSLPFLLLIFRPRNTENRWLFPGGHGNVTEAERKHDEFAKSLCNYLDDLDDWDSPVGKVHAMVIYDAIASGKIPHVILK